MYLKINRYLHKIKNVSVLQFQLVTLRFFKRHFLVHIKLWKNCETYRKLQSFFQFFYNFIWNAIYFSVGKAEDSAYFLQISVSRDPSEILF